MNNTLIHYNIIRKNRIHKLKLDQGILPYIIIRLSKTSLDTPNVQGEKSMTYSPVSCSRPTLLLTTVSWVSRWCVLHRYVICASLRVILIIINSPVGSIWYLPSITTRVWREGGEEVWITFLSSWKSKLIGRKLRVYTCAHVDDVMQYNSCFPAI